MTQASDTQDQQFHGFATNKFGEKYLFDVNANTFILSDSETVYRRYHPPERLNKEQFYIVAGTDSGLMVKYMLQHIDPRNRIIFVDLPEIIDQIKIEVDINEHKHQVCLSTLDSWLKDAQEIGLNAYAFSNRVQLIQSMAVMDGYYIPYLKFWTDIRISVQSTLFQIHSLLGLKYFMTEQLVNLADNVIPASIFRQKFEGKTCIILAGGPSLDEHIEWIKQNRDNFVIIAVSRICKRLHQVDLYPDIIAILDPHYVSYEVSKEMFYFPKALLVYAFHAIRNVVSQWEGNKVFLGYRVPWEDQFAQNQNIFISPPTVTNACLAFAVECGFSNILLAGVDLCFSVDGFSHAKGSIEAQTGRIINNVGEFVETYSGLRVETIPDYTIARQNLAIVAAFAKNKDIKVLNLSASAAVTEHIEHVNREDLELKPLDEEFHVSSNQLISDYKPDDGYTPSKMLDTLVDFQKQLREIVTLCQKALKYNNELFSENADFSFKLKMDKIEKKLDKNYPQAGRLIKAVGIGRFYDAMWRSDDFEWTDEEVQEAGEKYYKSYLDSTEECQNLINDAVNRLRMRLKESDPNASLVLLLDYWEEKDQLLRARIWRSQWPTRFEQLPEEIKNRFDKVESQFWQNIKAEPKQQLEIVKEKRSLTGVHAKTNMLVHAKDISSLHTMLKGLEEHPDKEKAKNHWQYAKACLLEIEGKSDEAIDHFNQCSGTERFDAYRHLISIQMKQHNFVEVESILEKLAEETPYYIPHYADILRINGKMDLALDKYTAYLQNYPDDLHTMLKLCKAYLEIGAQESAQWVANYVLSKQPGNQTAQSYLARSQQTG